VTEDELKHYVAMWQQTIVVQQHFNDIEWRIRGLALTALTFTVGAAAVAAREPAKLPIFGGHVGLSGLIASAGLLLWLAFWFVDDIWYHKLLLGAVRHGEALESELRDYLPAAGLTAAISASSRIDFSIRKNSRFTVLNKPRALHSTQKLRLFYFVVAALLFILALGLWGGTPPKDTSSVPSSDRKASAARPPSPTASQPGSRPRHLLGFQPCDTTGSTTEAFFRRCSVSDRRVG